MPAALDVDQTLGNKLQWFDAAHSGNERMDICQCKHPSSPRGRPSLISANTSGIPQYTTYVHHVLVRAALRVAYGKEKVVSNWWRRIDLLQKQIANISSVRTAISLPEYAGGESYILAAAYER